MAIRRSCSHSRVVAPHACRSCSSDADLGAGGRAPLGRTPSDRNRAVAAVRELLLALGDDPDRPGLRKTPDRVADLFLGFFAGLDEGLGAALGDPVPLDCDEQPARLIALTGISFRSMCEHHLLPFDGCVDIHYAPDQCIAGLSRLAGLVRVAAHRPQLQERMGQQIADTVMAVLQPHDVIVRIEPIAAAKKAVSVATCGTIPDAVSHSLAHS